MTAQEFAYWLKGYFELTPSSIAGLSASQVRVIKDHLQLVFTKVTPVVDIPPPIFISAANIHSQFGPELDDKITFMPVDTQGVRNDSEIHWHLHDVAEAERMRNECRSHVVAAEPQPLTFEEIKRAIGVDFVNENGKPLASC